MSDHSKPATPIGEPLDPLWNSSRFKAIWKHLDSECAAIADLVRHAESEDAYAVLAEGSNAEGAGKFIDARRFLAEVRDPLDEHVMLRSSLQRAISAALGRAAVITTDDVFDCALEHLIVSRVARAKRERAGRRGRGGGRSEAADHLGAARESLERRSKTYFDGSRFRLGAGRFPVALETPSHFLLGASPLAVWITTTPVPDELLYGRPAAVDHRSRHDVFGYLRGQCSPRAMRAIREDVVMLLRCMFRSLAVLGSHEPAVPIRRTPNMREGVAAAADFEPRFRILATCIECSYAPASARHTFANRVRNALRLLAEADAQRDDAVGMALMTAALEGLLVEDKERITAQIAENASTLLLSDRQTRRAGEKSIRALYDQRSLLLHGRDCETTSLRRRRVRDLVSAALMGLLFAHEALKLSGCATEDGSTLFDRLHAARTEGTPMPGVPENLGLSRHLRLLDAAEAGP